MAIELGEDVFPPLNLLLKAQSKDFVRTLLHEAFRYRNDTAPLSVIQTVSASLDLGPNESQQLVDFDWRVDVKTSSNAISRMSMPTCIMQLQVQENAAEKNAMPAVRRLNVELTKEKLDTMLDGLGKIRDQLSSVSK
ncbi:COMM domain-containing protein 9 [Acropora cervicornis]|uniref:COMM domain-containing protein 9 n=1 Tax=Acropora cervicornis TaxID=6130 RepID=A0AAD9QX46_ACRCE|nr:COMM domain-containing protein 9 [Acropora cervicornis]